MMFVPFGYDVHYLCENSLVALVQVLACLQRSTGFVAMNTTGLQLQYI